MDFIYQNLVLPFSSASASNAVFPFESRKLIFAPAFNSKSATDSFPYLTDVCKTIDKLHKITAVIIRITTDE